MAVSAAGALALAALPLGCGGGAASGGAGASGSTAVPARLQTGRAGTEYKAEYLSRANRICGHAPKRYKAKVEAMERERGSGSPPSKVEINLRAAVPPLHLLMEEMEALRPPRGDEAKIEAILDALESATDELEAKPGSALVGPKSPFAEFQKLTKEYELPLCNQL